MTDEQQHALTDQRRREADAVELAGLRADAERARWCEEKLADVQWSDWHEKWEVFWYPDPDAKRKYSVIRHPDRNAAIDAAMKGGQVDGEL